MRDDKLIEYYRSRAGEYEQIYYRDDAERRSEIDDEASRVTELARRNHVLELACGTGYWTERMSHSAKSITAVDAASEMIDEAKKKSYGVSVQFIDTDMFTFLFPVKHFDLVAVGFWFSHHPKESYEKFFDLVSRPLAPNGKIWIIDNNPPAEGANQSSVGVDEHGNNYKERVLENSEKHRILKNYFSETQLRTIFSDRFEIDCLTYKKYYWSVVLSLR
ncbi:MAG: class I SAM-dependent methyltransferase [candidate division Zixibacteria bacterium]|nr:class I SAM-dependent methyltransferase [candidate division Zixibacteria bacterium]